MEDRTAKTTKNPNWLQEIRKTYPKAFMKWEKEEDERLKKIYQNFLEENSGDFEKFLTDVAPEFGRNINGIRGRLAQFYQDIPGWDYEKEKQRNLQKLEESLAGVKPEHDSVLLEEYKKYAGSKSETFQAFANRVGGKLGISRKAVRARLSQLVDGLKIFTRNDLLWQDEAERIRPEPEIPEMDFSQNQELANALRLFEETNQNIFLTGEAGTGKSTLLQYFKYTTKKNVVVLAPTGVAAVNVGGQTIHSFCGFGPDITLSKVKKLAPWGGKKQLLQKLNTIIIDEISMVRADLLDCLDKFLRQNGPTYLMPFGGIQMIFIGDLYQLPPVEKDFSGGQGLISEYNSPYFFDARSFKKANFAFAELKQVYRQKDQVFLEILNAIRNNTASSEHLTILNQRSQTAGVKFTFERFAVYLTTTNARANQVNNFFLDRIKAEEFSFKGSAYGKFEDKTLPNDLLLRVKTGAQVMMLNNDQRKRWVNGTMGKIIGFAKTDNEDDDNNNEFNEGEGLLQHVEETMQKKKDTIIVELETGETVHVYPHTWEMFQFVLDKDTQKIDAKTVGTYTQYPLKLAWALTIHKAQGKTFDKVCVDLATGTFAHGQLYVALSRCRTLEGLILRQPVQPKDVLLDQRVVNFLSGFKTQKNSPSSA